MCFAALSVELFIILFVHEVLKSVVAVLLIDTVVLIGLLIVGIIKISSPRGMLMDYMMLKEASEKWGVSAWMINYYCAEGRIPGAMKMTTIWLFPKTAEKPMDMRTKQGRQRNENFYHRG